MHIDPAQLQSLIDIAVPGILGILGGVARFFYDVDAGKRQFTILGFVSATFTGAIAGCAMSELLPENHKFYGATMVAGFYGDYIISKLGGRMRKG